MIDAQKMIIEFERFDREKREAISRGKCTTCKRDASQHIYSAAGQREYRISGMCEECFDEMFQDDGDE